MVSGAEFFTNIIFVNKLVNTKEKLSVLVKLYKLNQVRSSTLGETLFLAFFVCRFKKGFFLNVQKYEPNDTF